MIITLAGSARSYSPSDDQLGRTSVELAAFDGEVGNGVLPMPDPAGTLSIKGGRQARVDEGSTLISDGFIIDEDRTKGFQPAGPSLEHGFGLMDANALLDGFRISRKRPAETDVARVLAFAAGDGPSWDTTWVIDANTVTMPAKRYYSDGGWTSELIPDLVSFTGKTLFLHDKAGGGRCLHYHILTDGHTCGLTISDVIADYLDSDTTFHPDDAERVETTVDLRNDVKGVDQVGHTSFASDATSISAHDADGLQHQAQIDIDATNQADLDVQTAAFLASQKDALDTWTCEIGPLDEDALALIRVGDLITVTSYVMGLTAAVKRISHMTLSPMIGEGSRARTKWWRARLELGAPIRRRARVKARKAPPAQPFVCIPTDFHVYPLPGLTCVVTETGADGACNSIDDHSPPESVHLYDGATYKVRYSVFHSAMSWHLFASLLHVGGESYQWDAGGYHDDLSNDAQPLSPWIEAENHGDYDVAAYLQNFPRTGTNAVDSSIFAEIVYVSGPDPRFEGLTPCTNGEPVSGQEVHDADFTGDGSTTSFTTAPEQPTPFAYRPTSLQVEVNGRDWTSEVTETDPAAGTYDLAYPPPDGSTVRVRYIAA